MATLQKFKFLATQCAVISSPARSPTTSPVVHIRRRKTLRMLLGRSHGTNTAFHRRFLQPYSSSPSPSPKPPQTSNQDNNNNNNNTSGSNGGVAVRSKLKDLFVSSPPPTAEEEEDQRLLKDGGRSCGGGGEGLVVVRRGGGGVRPLSATLRQRLLMRRAWRPVLVAIPEVSP